MRSIRILLSIALSLHGALAQAQLPSPTQDASDASSNNPQLTWIAGYTLTIPLIDANGIPGLYQQARIEYQPSTQSWRLANFWQARPLDNINSVELVVTQEIPAQVFLKVSGQLTNGCVQVGETGIRKEDARFNVYLFRQYVAPDCVGAAVITNFSKVIPLEVYGLPAGSYTWTLNGNFSGSFTLPRNNVLP